MTQAQADQVYRWVATLTAKQTWLMVWWLYHDAAAKSVREMYASWEKEQRR